ncbi:hypothetical protein NDU88_005179 [Pleurodeles waltl]|uniref:Uncharacterized protein n=1 Tax=Pleurodeles waltl TaxID=8319 RepID=A0AAV7MBC7_PLEWA|nr:hypothetical protein NDU88_005179 [Pleurodeles waltl]
MLDPVFWLDIQCDISDFFAINEGLVKSVGPVLKTFRVYLRGECSSKQFSVQKDLQKQLKLLELHLHQLKLDLEDSYQPHLVAELQEMLTKSNALADHNHLHSHRYDIPCTYGKGDKPGRMLAHIPKRRHGPPVVTCLTCDDGTVKLGCSEYSE